MQCCNFKLFDRCLCSRDHSERIGPCLKSRISHCTSCSNIYCARYLKAASHYATFVNARFTPKTTCFKAVFDVRVVWRVRSPSLNFLYSAWRLCPKFIDRSRELWNGRLFFRVPDSNWPSNMSGLSNISRCIAQISGEYAKFPCSKLLIWDNGGTVEEQDCLQPYYQQTHQSLPIFLMNLI